MLHILLISVFLAMFVRESLARPLLGRGEPLVVAALSVGVMAALAAAGHILIWRQARRMDRGRYGAVRRADQIAAGMRVAAVALHAYLVLGIGWLDAVRTATGNLVLVDELLAALPVIGVFVVSWWSMYQVDHRLRDAVFLGELDQGMPVRPMPTRREYVLAALRHQAALVLVPVLALVAWKEVVAQGAQRLDVPEWFPWLGVQVAGMAVLLTCMPLAMRWIWDTTALGPGPLRERLESMCRAHRVRVRELLVWRTHGTMINGAVMGLAGPMRYILLTDALLDLLPQAQVEAVTAHELGHVRRRHMVWLAAAALSSIMLGALAADAALRAVSAGLADSDWAQIAVPILSMGAGLLAFGAVSRRFEWQADAFAVQHLSGYHRGSPGPVVLTEEAVDAMSGALESVARLNHIPRERFSWRHGSIASRQRRLRDLVGRRADRLRADRHAGLAKIAAAAGIVAVVVAVAVGVS